MKILHPNRDHEEYIQFDPKKAHKTILIPATSEGRLVSESSALLDKHSQ